MVENLECNVLMCSAHAFLKKGEDACTGFVTLQLIVPPVINHVYAIARGTHHAFLGNIIIDGVVEAINRVTICKCCTCNWS